jgi:hypothetical protein
MLRFVGKNHHGVEQIGTILSHIVASSKGQQAWLCGMSKVSHGPFSVLFFPDQIW